MAWCNFLSIVSMVQFTYVLCNNKPVTDSFNLINQESLHPVVELRPIVRLKNTADGMVSFYALLVQFSVLVSCHVIKNQKIGFTTKGRNLV